MDLFLNPAPYDQRAPVRIQKLKECLSHENLRSAKVMSKYWKEKKLNSEYSIYDSQNPLATQGEYGSQSFISESRISNSGKPGSGYTVLPEISAKRKYNVFAKSYLSSLNEESLAIRSQILKTKQQG